MIKYMKGNKALDLKFLWEKILYNTEVPKQIEAWELTWETMFWKQLQGSHPLACSQRKKIAFTDKKNPFSEKMEDWKHLCYGITEPIWR